MYDDNLPERIKQIYNACNVEDQPTLLQILQELSAYGESQTYKDLWLVDFKEIPATINEFITSDTYLGKVTRQGNAIYPSWKTVMKDIFAAGNTYQEIVLTGATRIGKTSTAITCVAYLLHWLMCLRDPQEFFGKKSESKFSILFFNLTKDLAAGVAFREFNDTLKASPWFNAHGTFSKSDRNFYYIPEGDKISVDFGSDAAHALGKQVFAAIMDEINFSRAGVVDVNKAKKHMKELYTTVADRIKGTFRKGGEVYGKIFAVSSKRSDSDFMEQYVEDQLAAGAGGHMYVFSKPQWEVLPKSQYKNNGAETFTIAVGDRHHRGFVISPEQCTQEGLAELIEQGYKLMYPPIDYFVEFKADFDIALRDIAGITTPGAMSFISQDAITACIGKRNNPFLNDILQIGTKDSYSIEEFFHKENVDPVLLRYPMFIHLDLSLTTDRTGISGIVISGRKDITGEDGKVISQPTFSQVFSLALEAPRGDKIPYAKITEFICWLRRNGFNISRISRDQFQSEYLAQLLEAQRFDVDKISLDRTPDGYMALRSILLEERIDMIKVPLLEDELIHLQRDAVTGKVDHTVDNSKDVSDSFAGAIWNAILNNPGVPVPTKKVANAIASVNGNRGYVPKVNQNNGNPLRRNDLPPMFSNSPYKKY